MGDEVLTCDRVAARQLVFLVSLILCVILHFPPSHLIPYFYYISRGPYVSMSALL